MFHQVLPTGTQQNVWKQVRKICVMMLRLKGLTGNISKQDRERHKTKGLISKRMTLHVRYRFWYISLLSSAKQQREMTKFKVLCKT